MMRSTRSAAAPAWVRATVRAGVLAGVLLAALAAWQSPLRAQEAPSGEEDLLSGFEAPLPGETQDEGQQQEQQADDDLAGGFGEAIPFEAPEGQPAAETEPWWALGGFVRLDSSYNYAHDAPPPGETDWRGLSKLRLALQLELSLDLGADWAALVSGQANRDFVYAIRGRDEYTEQVLDAYEEEAEFREVWLRGTPVPSLDLKLGRQIVVWGKSDNIRVVDVLNPLDNREPGLTDLEDLRLPVTMSRVDYYFGAWGLSAIAVHEIRFNKDPVPGHDFFPDALAQQPPEEVPDDGGENTEYGLALSGVFTGWDLAFYGARFFDDQAHVELVEGRPRRVHSRLTLAGTAVAVALGNWLLKSEVGVFRGLEFFNAPGERFTRVDALVGAEYSGFTDTTLGFEAVDRHLLDFDEALEQPPDFQREDINQYVLSYRADLLRQKLGLVAVLSFFGARAERGSLQRYSATYELAPALNLTGGVAVYTPGDGSIFLLETAQDNDRVFTELKWSF